MVRPLALLVFLASCGAGGVCAGCGADDTADEIPDAFTFHAVAQASDCFGPGERTIAITSARSTPVLSGHTCAAAVDRGDTWFIDCLGDGAGVRGIIQIDLSKTLDGGTFYFGLTGGDPVCGWPIVDVTLE